MQAAERSNLKQARCLILTIMCAILLPWEGQTLSMQQWPDLLMLASMLLLGELESCMVAETNMSIWHGQVLWPDKLHNSGHLNASWKLVRKIFCRFPGTMQCQLPYWIPLELSPKTLFDVAQMPLPTAVALRQQVEHARETKRSSASMPLNAHARMRLQGQATSSASVSNCHLSQHFDSSVMNPRRT